MMTDGSFEELPPAPGEIMEREILESAQAIETLLKRQQDKRAHVPIVLARTRVWAAAHGSSLHALNIVALELASRGVALRPMTPQTMMHLLTTPHVDLPHQAIFISQSGETRSTMQALAAISERGVASVLLTNRLTPDGLPASVVHYSLRAGTERAVCATKTVMATLLSLDLLSLSSCHDREAVYGEWQHLADCLAELIGAIDVSSCVQPRHVWVLGDGSLQAVAGEVALKAMEATLTSATALPYEDALHGPVIAMQADDLIISLLPQSAEPAEADDEQRVLEQIQTRIEQLHGKRAQQLVISVDDPALGSGLAYSAAHLACGQQAVLQLARAWGRNPDAPPLLNKVTNPE